MPARYAPVALLAAALLVAALPSAAQVRSTANGATRIPVTVASAQRDPNRIICVTDDTLGSRLQTHRTCLSAAQWTEMRRDMRQTTEHVQNNKWYNGTSGWEAFQSSTGVAPR